MQTITLAEPKTNEVVIKLSAAALNHRDHFLRQHLYPKIYFDVPLCCDGVGTVVRDGSGTTGSQSWMKKRVVINPGFGWVEAPDGPESPTGYLTLGASAAGTGTLQTHMVVSKDEIFEAPPHLSDIEAAALPAVGITAWRALMVRSGNALPGRNILVTGIGGGVALMVLLFGKAAGCNVFVTSSSAEKLARAKQLGADGGVNYREKDWDRQLLRILPTSRPYIDTVIDGAGGDIVQRASNFLKQSGTIVSYGMTISSKVDFSMRSVLQNISLVGTTMGSRKDFSDMLNFVNVHCIRPVVSRIVKGIENFSEVEELFRELREGKQFGKLVIQIHDEGLTKNQRPARL